MQVSKVTVTDAVPIGFLAGELLGSFGSLESKHFGSPRSAESSEIVFAGLSRSLHLVRTENDYNDGNNILPVFLLNLTCW